MRVHQYPIAKGDQVQARFVGTIVPLDEPTTMEEAVPRFYENVEALIKAANANRRIACNRAARDEASKDTATPESVRTVANAVVVKVPRESTGESKPKATSERAQKAAKFDARTAAVVAKGPQAIKVAIELGALTQEDVDAYLASQSAVPAGTPVKLGRESAQAQKPEKSKK
jgi:hypothetical protein